MSATDAFENPALDHLLGTAALALPPQGFLALFTADPGDAGSLAAEVVGLGYARQPIAFAPAVGGQAANAAQLTFPQATGGSWGTLTHWAIMSAATAGAMRIKGQLSTPRAIADTDQFVVPAGSITVSLD